MSLRAPDVAGELEGVRAWRTHGGFLWSLYRPVLWAPGSPVRARCLAVDPSPGAHPSPSRRCRCGLYAARRASEGVEQVFESREALASLLGLPSARSEDYVFGEVWGWGLMEVGPDGWRAQWQRVRAIFAGHPDAGDLAERYKVPLVA